MSVMERKSLWRRNLDNLFILISGLCQHVEATLKLAQLILRPWLGIVLDVANRLLCQISVRAARIARVIQAVAPAFEPLNFACPRLVTLENLVGCNSMCIRGHRPIEGTCTADGCSHPPCRKGIQKWRRRSVASGVHHRGAHG